MVRTMAFGLVLPFGAVLVPASASASEALLTLVDGASGEEIELTREELEALPQYDVTTETEFADGMVTYRGPLVRDALDLLAIGRSESVRVYAANDYYVDVPTSDFRDYNVILALKADGIELSRRDKGPIWLMYPISNHPALADPVYISRLIWQVVRVESL
jgi:hypothetical protein